VTPHGRRRFFARRVLEQNVETRVIQASLGHDGLKTVALCTRAAVNLIRDIRSPLERPGVNLASRPARRSRMARPRLEAADVFRGDSAAAISAAVGASSTKLTS